MSGTRFVFPVSLLLRAQLRKLRLFESIACLDTIVTVATIDIFLVEFSLQLRLKMNLSPVLPARTKLRNRRLFSPSNAREYDIDRIVVIRGPIQCPVGRLRAVIEPIVDRLSTHNTKD